MSDLPEPQDGEELDLGEIEEGEDAGGDEAPENGADEVDAGDDDEAPEGQEEDVEAPPRPRRKTEAQRWRERSERNERELEALKNQFQGFSQARTTQPQQPDPALAARQAQERAERLAMMSPVEAAEFIAGEKEQQFRQMLMMQHLQTEDRLDKRDYDQQARTSRLHQQYRDRVEAALASERQQGNLRATREDILARLYGQDAIQRSGRAAPRQRQEAAARVARQRTQPTGARGDGAGGGRRGSWGDPEYDERMAREALRKGQF